MMLIYIQMLLPAMCSCNWSYRQTVSDLFIVRHNCTALCEHTGRLWASVTRSWARISAVSIHEWTQCWSCAYAHQCSLEVLAHATGDRLPSAMLRSIKINAIGATAHAYKHPRLSPSRKTGIVHIGCALTADAAWVTAFFEITACAAHAWGQRVQRAQAMYTQTSMQTYQHAYDAQLKNILPYCLQH